MRRLLFLLPFLWLATPSHSQQWLPGGTGIPIVCAYNASPGTVATGLFIYAQCDSGGTLKTTASGGTVAANVTIVAPLGHATVDTGAVSIVPSATATFPISGSISNTTFAATQATASSLNATVVQPTAANLNATVAVPTWAGGTLGAMANYGTSPGAVLVPGVNSYCTNCTSASTAPAGFTPNGNYATLAVTSATGNVALPAGGGSAVAVSNLGSQTAFVNFGTSNAVTATVSQIPIAGGQTIAFTIGANTYLAGITAAPNTTTLTLSGGVGAYSGTGGSVSVTAPPNDVLAGPTNFTGAGTLAVNSQGSGSVGLLITGTFTGAAWTLQGSVDGTTYATIPFWDNTNSGTIYTAQPSATTGGTFKTSAAGYKSVRVNVSAVSTGTLVATLNSSAGSVDPPISAFGTNSNITGVAGTATAFDPCTWKTKTNLAISSNATALTQIIAASGSTKIYVCSLSLLAAGATAYNLNTGTGSNCGSSTAALLGSTTAANGLTFATGGGMTLGNGGATVLVTAASSEICTLQSTAVYVSGSMTYVQQ